MRLEYLENMAFDTSVDQSRILVLEYAMASITFLQHIFRHERFMF